MTLSFHIFVNWLSGGLAVDMYYLFIAFIAPWVAVLFVKECYILFVHEKIRCSAGAGLRAFFGEDPACFSCSDSAIVIDSFIYICPLFNLVVRAFPVQRYPCCLVVGDPWRGKIWAAEETSEQLGRVAKLGQIGLQLLGTDTNRVVFVALGALRDIWRNRAKPVWNYVVRLVLIASNKNPLVRRGVNIYCELWSYHKASASK